jgi:nucleoside-diphosphate-sugar epimerase
MSRPSVLITGSEGVVGKVLTGYTIANGERPSLDANITRVDLRPERGSDKSSADWRGVPYNSSKYVDNKNAFIRSGLKDVEELRELLLAHNAVVHAAWSNEGILDPESQNIENLKSAVRLLKVAAGIGSRLAPKIILPSSVNANVPVDWRMRRDEGRLITVTEPGIPYAHNRGGQPGPMTTRYGWSKLAIESLAKTYAQQYGLDVYVTRLGGMNMADKPSSEYEPHKTIAASERGRHFDIDWEDAVRLEHSEFVNSIQAQVESPRLPGKFELVQAVSDNPGRVHEI